MALGTVPASDERNFGMLGMHGTVASNYAVRPPRRVSRDERREKTSSWRARGFRWFFECIIGKERGLTKRDATRRARENVDWESG